MNTEDHDLIESPQPAPEAAISGSSEEPAGATPVNAAPADFTPSDSVPSGEAAGGETAAAEITALNEDAGSPSMPTPGAAVSASDATPAPVEHAHPPAPATGTDASAHGLPGLPLPASASGDAGEDAARLQAEQEAAAEDTFLEMERLLDEHSQPSHSGEGNVIEGRVLEIRDTEVIVDISQKAEGSVPIEQVKDHLGNLRVAVGDSLDVVIVRGVDYTKEGYTSLSHEKVSRPRARDNPETAPKDDLPVLGRVLSRTKAPHGGCGFEGVHAGFPRGCAAGAESGPVRRAGYSGKDPEDEPPPFECGGIAAGHRRAGSGFRKEHTLADLAEGAVVNGIVKSLTEYGAFVDRAASTAPARERHFLWAHRQTGRRAEAGPGDQRQGSQVRQVP